MARQGAPSCVVLNTGVACQKPNMQMVILLTVLRLLLASQHFSSSKQAKDCPQNPPWGGCQKLKPRLRQGDTSGHH